MPFESKAQQRFMFATKPAMAKEWANKTPNIEALPEHVKKAAVKRLRHKGLANERRFRLAADKKTSFNTMEGK